MSKAEHTRLILANLGESMAIEIQTDDTPHRLVAAIFHRGDGNPMRLTYAEAFQFGEKIVRACNNFDALAEALLAYVTQEERAAPYSSSPLREKARAALQAAGIE